MPQPFGIPDNENPEWTTREIRASKPGSDVFSPEFLKAAAAERRRRGKQKAPTKQMIALRLDRDVLDAYRSTGRGWQGRMRQTLATHAPRHRRNTIAAKPKKRRAPG